MSDSREFIARLQHDFLQNANAAILALARVAAHRRWSDSELRDMFAVLQLAQKRPPPLLKELTTHPHSLSTRLVWQEWARATNTPVPDFDPRYVRLSYRSEQRVDLPIWSAKSYFKSFFACPHQSRHLITLPTYDGENFGHFVSGEEFRDCVLQCSNAEIPVCLELSIDDTNVANGVALAPLTLNISNSSDELKGTNRYVTRSAGSFFLSHKSNIKTSGSLFTSNSTGALT